MGNQSTGRVWALDTAEELRTGNVNIHRMDWHPSAENDDLEVQDASGVTIWKARAKAGAPNSEVYAVESWINPAPFVSFVGFVLAVIDGGTLYVTAEG